MRFRIGGDGNVEIANLAKTRDQVRGIVIAVCHILGVLRRIAAQCNDVPNSHIPVLSRDVVNFSTTGTDAREMRGSGQSGLSNNPSNGRVRSLARRPVRTVGHRHKTRRQTGKSLNGPPQGCVHRLGVGWEKFEGHGRLLIFHIALLTLKQRPR